MDFRELVIESGITKAELGRRLGITPDRISAWQNKPQRYAVAYLELLIKHNRILSYLENGNA